jgi:hypothetical protein
MEEILDIPEFIRALQRRGIIAKCDGAGGLDIGNAENLNLNDEYIISNHKEEIIAHLLQEETQKEGKTKKKAAPIRDGGYLEQIPGTNIMVSPGVWLPPITNYTPPPSNGKLSRRARNQRIAMGNVEKIRPIATINKCKDQLEINRKIIASYEAGESQLSSGTYSLLKAQVKLYTIRLAELEKE